jgi:cellulose synthase A
MDPTKDLAAYGYGSVAWKERVESWKQRQEKMQVMMTESGQAISTAKGGHSAEDGTGGPDLPM